MLHHPQLWERVDLGYGWCKPSDAGVAAMLPRWCTTRTLSLSGCATLSDAGLRAVAEGCPLLESLDLSHTSGFSEAGVSSALQAMLQRPAGPGSSPLRRIDLSFIQLTPATSALDQVVRDLLAAQAGNAGGPVLQVGAGCGWRVGRMGGCGELAPRQAVPCQQGGAPVPAGSHGAQAHISSSSFLSWPAPAPQSSLPMIPCLPLLSVPSSAHSMVQELVVEGCPMLTHLGLRAITETAVEQQRPLLGALRVLDLTQSAGVGLASVRWCCCPTP